MITIYGHIFEYNTYGILVLFPCSSAFDGYQVQIGSVSIYKQPSHVDPTSNGANNVQNRLIFIDP